MSPTDGLARMQTLTKDWDRHVVAVEDIARAPGFQQLRDLILERADPSPGDRVLDLGCGTGLLTIALANQVECVWALDISPAMSEYLRLKVESAGIGNVKTGVASAVSLPLVDDGTDLVVSNYCFHHLRDKDKLRALAEVVRVLVPGGRLVLGDMMFSVGLSKRDRQVVSSKTRAMLRKGPKGVWRLARNAARYMTASWERPASPEWWDRALRECGFVDVSIEVLHHEGGLAVARKPT